MSDMVERLRDARSWLNNGDCCGDKDSAGICAAPACIFGEALKELYEAADEIERLRKALQEANRGLEIALCWSDNDGTWVAHEAVVKSSKAALAALAGKEEK